MSDEAKKALEQFLLSLLEATKEGAYRAAEQIPLVLQEKLRFALFSETIILLFTLAGMVLTVYLFRLISRRRDERVRIEGSAFYRLSGGDLYATGQVGCVALGVLSGVCCMLSIARVAKVLLAPRLYLLEWAMSLMRQ